MLLPYPGPPAITTALSISGFYSSKFIVCGLPSRNLGRGRSFLVDTAQVAGCVFESPPPRPSIPRQVGSVSWCADRSLCHGWRRSGVLVGIGWLRNDQRFKNPRRMGNSCISRAIRAKKHLRWGWMIKALIVDVLTPSALWMNAEPEDIWRPWIGCCNTTCRISCTQVRSGSRTRLLLHLGLHLKLSSAKPGCRLFFLCIFLHPAAFHRICKRVILSQYNVLAIHIYLKESFSLMRSAS